jgi:hypothetical protein
MTIILWLCLGFVALVLAFLLHEDWQLLSRERRRAKGTVIDHVRGTDEGHEFFDPRIRFAVESGRQVEFTDTYRKDTQQPPLGTIVDVVYAVDAPDKARVPRPFRRLMIYGFLILLVGVLVGRLLGLLQ